MCHTPATCTAKTNWSPVTPWQRILIAGHGETVDAAATLLLGLAPGSSARVGFGSAHASITRWNMPRNRFGQEIWILAVLNDTRHLASLP